MSGDAPRSVATLPGGPAAPGIGGGDDVLEVVTMKEIDAVFAVTDRLGLHREALVIPLGPQTPGRVRKLPNGKLEIVVDAERPIEEWVRDLPALIAAAQGTPQSQ